MPPTSLLDITTCDVLHLYAAPKEMNTLQTQTKKKIEGSEESAAALLTDYFFFCLTWKDDVGWMLTLACFHRSPWLPLSDHTGPSEVVWPFCFRKALSVPA